MILGKCPYCDDGNVVLSKKNVLGKNTKLYTCSNASWLSEDGEMFELHKNATCSLEYGVILCIDGAKEVLVYLK